MCVKKNYVGPYVGTKDLMTRISINQSTIYKCCIGLLVQGLGCFDVFAVPGFIGVRENAR